MYQQLFKRLWIMNKKTNKQTNGSLFIFIGNRISDRVICIYLQTIILERF